MPDLIKEFIEKKDFDKFIKEDAGKLYVIDCYATWCGPCKVIAPKFKELSEKYGGQVIFAKVDVDEGDEIAEEYGVSALPTFLFLKNGKKVDAVVGASLDKLQEAVEKYK